ncbi:alpha/beta hydrolase [Pseudoalteromonas peptidolytica]|uniref:Phospholipase/carboxylesterase n=1 Tax=Pseudoalteromonas peptidolytica F12-50-A1 TaxID=1315280 RepID=A0A8I0T619_9GAMM|nr:dienelactone hydrolase family protein [Pseudoalteromonas peptidolytica]MBE0347987.1 phospholipase/carboxylesterase [Pseudoalteromonas peptidolytica F12-50-A1]NLR16409.1 carboxylesterase [Pseudoalteromonas peptidolytica]GEK08541.1 carboxylesterase [Pseudoalteromonas peptidolytica]
MLEFVEHPAVGEHKASIIWLHGLGDSGNGFLPIAPELNLPGELGVQFIFPHAPEQPVTINGGMVMRAWYDIKSFDLDKRADEQGVRDSSAQVEALIQAQLDKGIPANRIILAGFSQGGVIALHLAPRLAVKLAGVMALSTYMCVPEKLSAEAKQTELAIFMAHGSADPVVPVFAGEQAFNTLKQQGYEVSWQDYPMEHQVCLEELKAIRAWLIERLSD